jgi:hypothetical protein
MKTGATLTRTNIFLSNKKVANLAVIRELSFYSQSSLGTQTGVDQLTSIGWPISGGSIVFLVPNLGIDGHIVDSKCSTARKIMDAHVV